MMLNICLKGHQTIIKEEESCPICKEEEEKNNVA